jgi:hypothetical protein
MERIELALHPHHVMRRQIVEEAEVDPLLDGTALDQSAAGPRAEWPDWNAGNRNGDQEACGRRTSSGSWPR